MSEHDLDIAVIAMEGRFPGADSVMQLWEKLLAETDLVTAATPEDFLAAGGDPDLLDNPDLVLDRAVLSDITSFDHQYFGLTRAEAELLDPQHRVFFQVAVHALEKAGVDPAQTPHLIGVYAGSGQGHYERKVLPPHGRQPESLETFNTAISNLVSSLPTRLAYCLDLKGPAICVQTACSTSLVAIHLACQDLLSLRCDIALAGGVTLEPTPNLGQLASLGGLLSPDGRCRPFSADANGIGSGDAAAVVVLKRYADALADGDHIHAVIRASAINNDGRDKVGFTAPSISGQARVIREALELSLLKPHQIGYIEAHGTGTPTGDPIEIAALERAFGTLPAGSCRIGSVKSNLGHTDTASGVVSFIKAALCVEHGVIPATLHFNRPNPEIDFDSSSFRVVTHTEPWSGNGELRRAGVSSFGIGGTNAHIILEQHEAPAPSSASIVPPPVGPPALILSASSRDSLLRSAANLHQWLLDHPEVNLDDVAATLRSRPTHGHIRGGVVAMDRDEALAGLQELTRVPTPSIPRQDGELAWFFPGGGTLSPDCIRTLDSLPNFARAWQEASQWAHEHGVDLDAVISRGPHNNIESSLGSLAVQYGLIEHLRTVLPAPDAVIGHSLGEYGAAIASGVLTPTAAMTLALARGQVLDEAGGLTLLVGGSSTEIEPTLTGSLSIAADNGPTATLVSGPDDQINRWHHDHENDWLIRRVDVPVAVHHGMLEAHLHHLDQALARITPQMPTEIRFISTSLGRQATTELCDPSYWLNQVRAPVKFAAAVAALGQRALGGLEIGAGQSLTALVPSLGPVLVPTMPRRTDPTPPIKTLTQSVVSLWEAGVDIRWPTRRGRLPLPPYPFESIRCWPKLMPDPVLVLDGLDSGFDTALRTADSGHPLLIATSRPPAAASLSPEPTPTIHHPDHEVLNQDKVLDAVAAAHIALAFREHISNADEPIDIPGLAAAFEIQPIYRRLLIALIQLLDDQGLLEHHGDSFLIRDPGEPPKVTGHTSHLIAHCAADLIPVMSGRLSEIESLLMDGSQQAAEDDRSAVGLGAIRELVISSLRDLTARADGQPMRVIELGAGRGMLFWPMVTALHDQQQVQFTFTDIGRSFVLDAQHQAAELGLDRVKFSVLDAGQPVAEQGFAVGTYDVVVAYNCLHAVPKARDGIAACRDLLADGGTLLLVELHSLPGHGVLTAGLHKGMWHFADIRDDDMPLLSAQQWSKLLELEGFSKPQVPYVNAHHILLTATRGSNIRTERLLRLRSRTAVTVATWKGLAGTTWQSATKSPAAHHDTFAGDHNDADKKALTGLAQRPVSTPYRAPETELEHRIAQVWAQTLGLDTIGLDDSFFDLGGESLLAIRMVTKLRDELRINFPVRTLFDHLTVASLASHIESLRSSPDITTTSSTAPSAITRRRSGRRGSFTDNGRVVLDRPTDPSSEPPSKPDQGLP